MVCETAKVDRSQETKPTTRATSLLSADGPGDGICERAVRNLGTHSRRRENTPEEKKPIFGVVESNTLPDNRIVTHLHGGLTPWFSDGPPFQWYTPGGEHGLVTGLIDLEIKIGRDVGGIAIAEWLDVLSAVDPASRELLAGPSGVSKPASLLFANSYAVKGGNAYGA